ncbi:MAG: CAP domain-containing protein [Candidatus Saccharimonadales bacterium]
MKNKTFNKKRKGSLVQRIFGNKKITVLVLFLIIFAGIGGYRIYRSHASTIAPDSGEADEYNRINDFRIANGKPALGTSECIAKASREWTLHMVQLLTTKSPTDALQHSNPIYFTNHYCGDGWTSSGENIGYGYLSNCDRACAFQSFVNSTKHRQNMLGIDPLTGKDSAYNRMGVGYVEFNGMWWITQEFANCGSCGGNYSESISWFAPQHYLNLAIRPGASSGYKIDNYGDISGINTANISAGAGYWPFQDVVRSATVNSSGAGYKLDKSGGLWPFKGAPAANGAPYFAGQDIARDVKLVGSSTKGYVLDGFGGLHEFNGAAKSIISFYKSGWDIARKFAINHSGTQGYVMDGYGGLHPFSTGSTGWPPAVTNGPYWAGSSVAEAVVLRNDGNSTYDGRQGYILDTSGGIHAFSSGGRCRPAAIKSPFYAPALPIATDMVITKWGTCSTPSKGYLLTVDGMVRAF